MDQERFGKIIKYIRNKNKLTQKQFADKYNVTYQAVSKWENGKNMPDISIIKQICKDYNISLEERVGGNFKKKKTKKHLIFLLIVFIIILVLFFIVGSKDEDFTFKTLTSSCNNFEISGSIAYNDKKTSIYITNVKYCGQEDDEEYAYIDCSLYEMNDDIIKEISSCDYEGNDKITLEEFLNTLTISVDNYKKTCKEYAEDSLYLSINAKTKNDKEISYKIPLKLEPNCNN